MMVTCPTCGALSRDVEFCDRCNADLAPPPAARPPAQCPAVPGQSVRLSREQIAHLRRPESSVLLRRHGQAWRVHWIASELWPQYQANVEARCEARCPALAPCGVVNDARGRWVIAEASGRAVCPWRQPVGQEPLVECRRMIGYLDLLRRGLQSLGEAGFRWLTFDPMELEFAPGTQEVRFTNLDVRLFPVGPIPAGVSFNPRFAAPELTGRSRTDFQSVPPQAGRIENPSYETTDVYHLALVGYYWLARLLPGGFPGQGLEAFRHQLPALRVYCPHLPPGIAPVLARGLARDPEIRFATPADLCDALRTAIDDAERRGASTAAVMWEIGTHTRTGRAKEALDRANEDAVLTRTYADPPRSLAVVADGITVCDVGTGALASLLTCLALDNTFDAQCTAADFQPRVTQACQRASENLLSWAVERGQQPALLAGGDLMGTTLTAVWLEGHQLYVANLGDSRVYLLAEAYLEQLTVDGDLGTSLLAAGTPPEHVVELGSAAHALRECVGGCECTPDGRLKLAEQYNEPRFSRWTVRPGDVVVVCTDGLVEEGLYLEPAALERLLRDHRERSAEELAVLLADAADAVQRVPSVLEPEGTGDNISCIVIKIQPLAA